MDVTDSFPSIVATLTSGARIARGSLTLLDTVRARHDASTADISHPFVGAVSSYA
jgi:hypothetical protein